MANDKRYRFNHDNGYDNRTFIEFDSKGNIVKAKGTMHLDWWATTEIDEELIGMHVDELAERLKKYGTENAYIKFEAQVHVPLLKKNVKRCPRKPLKLLKRISYFVISFLHFAIDYSNMC